ncbi:potassium channel family protein [Alteromonas oceanisediminis]|uniref:potassium channel family protein n=1 Tax=Alteromonas oceanisediminis TaxID=2836180 RepID=UPI001BDB1A1A|nr:potassium channel family protein [Alteromonas oceanisediminis]MBT0585712.1 NAD-binding protein [Alteromonas oceanisediminis]
MNVWVKVRKVMLQHFSEARWYTIVLALLFYAITSWLLLLVANETALLSLSEFVYWLAVTGSTVGYGDLSPTTPAGKMIVAFYIIPLGLSIFALVVGRIAGWVTRQWQRGVLGLKTLTVNDHILVIGWNEARTLQLLKLLLQERADSSDKPDIVLCVRAEITNPLPGDIEFVKVTSFNDDDHMERAGVKDARTIIIDNPLDDVTMTTALYCSHQNTTAHIVAYFQDESLSKLLVKHCPNVECTPSVAVEMLAKSAFDPGSSVLHHDLLDVQEGQAQYSVLIPNDINSLPISALFSNFKTHYDAILIGYAPKGDYRLMRVNPPLSDTVQGGDKLFYIAEHRVNNIDWSRLAHKEARDV